MNEKAMKPTMADIKNAAGPKAQTLVQIQGMRQVSGEQDLFIIDGLEYREPVQIEQLLAAFKANGLDDGEADLELERLFTRIHTLKLAKLLGNRVRVMGPA